MITLKKYCKASLNLCLMKIFNCTKIYIFIIYSKFCYFTWIGCLKFKVFLIFLVILFRIPEFFKLFLVLGFFKIFKFQVFPVFQVFWQPCYIHSNLVKNNLLYLHLNIIPINELVLQTILTFKSLKTIFFLTNVLVLRDFWFF